MCAVSSTHQPGVTKNQIGLAIHHFTKQRVETLAEISGSLYLVSTAIFAIMAIVIGIRLQLLFRRTGQQAERMLGLGIMFTAGLGYGIMMAGLVGRSFAGGEAAPEYFYWITLTGWVFHNLGVMFMLRFIRLVFRPDAAWATWLIRGMVVVMWVFWSGYVADGGVETGTPNASYWAMLSVIGTYPIWSGCEAYRYYGLMRRRVAIGLGGPIVANRFLLWSLASASATASIWVINVPYILGLPFVVGVVSLASSIAMLITGIFGLITVALYWLTFFPPRWYQAYVAALNSADVV